MNNKNAKIQDLNNAQQWSIAMGILLIIMGILGIVILPSFLCILAIASHSIALQSMTIVLSWAFVISGILRMNLAIQTRRARGFWLKLLLSILYIAVSILLLKGIIGFIFSLTLALGITIFIEGALEIFLAFQLRPKSSLLWLLLKGITMIIMGISIWSEKPFSDFGILVLLPGISLLSTGIWTVMFSKAIALQPDTPSLVKQNKVLVTPNLHKSC